MALRPYPTLPNSQSHVSHDPTSPRAVASLRVCSSSACRMTPLMERQPSRASSSTA